MPKLFATDPRRLGYDCDDYDLPVRDLATNACYQNYCAAEAAGVKNWDYECDPEIRFPNPHDDAGAAPGGTFVYGGAADGGGWDGGGAWIGDGGSPWRRRRPGRPPSSGGPSWGPRHPGPHAGGSSGPSGGTTPDGRRVVGGGPRPGRTTLPGSDSPTSHRMGGGGPVTGTVRRGGGLRHNPAGSGDGSSLSLLPGEGTSTLATAGRGGAIHTNPSGSGTAPALVGGSDGSGTVLSRTMTAYPQYAQAKTNYRTEYHAQPEQRTASTRLRDEPMHLATQPEQHQAMTTARSRPLARGLAPQRSGSASRFAPRGGIARAMHGLGEFTFQSAAGAALLFGGALLVGSYFATR